METDIVHADPVYRRKLFLIYALTLAMLVVLPLLFGPSVKQYVMTLYGRPFLLVLESAGVGFLLLFIPPSLYLIHTGHRVLKEGRMPHSRMRALYDTPILRGRQATLRGKSMLWLGRFCLVAVILGSLATHFIFYKFKTDPSFFLRH